MNSPPSVRWVKAFAMEEILEMSVQELRKILEDRVQDMHNGSSKTSASKEIVE